MSTSRAMPTRLLEQFQSQKSCGFLAERAQQLQALYPQKWWVDVFHNKIQPPKRKPGNRGSKSALLYSFLSALVELEHLQTYDQLKRLVKSRGHELAKKLKCPLTDPKAAGQSTTFDVSDFFADECRFTKTHMPGFDAHRAERECLDTQMQHVCMNKECWEEDKVPVFSTLSELKAHHSREHDHAKLIPHVKCPIPSCLHTFCLHGRPNRISEHYTEQHTFGDAFLCAAKGCNRIFWRRGKADEHQEKMHGSSKALKILEIERWDVFLLFLGTYAWARDLCAQYLQSCEPEFAEIEAKGLVRDPKCSCVSSDGQIVSIRARRQTKRRRTSRWSSDMDDDDDSDSESRSNEKLASGSKEVKNKGRPGGGTKEGKVHSTMTTSPSSRSYLGDSECSNEEDLPSGNTAQGCTQAGDYCSQDISSVVDDASFDHHVWDQLRQEIDVSKNNFFIDDENCTIDEIIGSLRAESDNCIWM